jgi:acyl-CoA thioesterase I
VGARGWHKCSAWLITLILLAGCAAGAGSSAPGSGGGEASALRYVALGDSYTIGTSVAEEERWPNQLVERVAGLELVANLGVNGFTSADLIEQQLPQLEALRPEVVSLLVGVNDVVQGVPEAQYAGNVAIILEELLTRLPPGRIVCVATPDYTATPMGAAFGDPSQQRDGIRANNAILREACETRDIAFVPEIFELSQAAAVDPSLVADDRLHPSGAQYARWTDAIAPVVESLLRD